MRRLLPAPALAAATPLLPAAAATAQEPVIRPGVTVAGVDVSNQPLSQAAGTIDRAFHHQLLIRNVSARVGGKGYRLTTKAPRGVFAPAKPPRRAYIAGTKTAEPVD